MATQQSSAPTAKQVFFVRFSIFQRVEHIVLIASFTLLAITGLVQKFSTNPVADWLIGALGGVQNVRTIHHVAAVIFIIEGIYHFMVLAHKVYVQRVEMSMLPGVRDGTDALDEVRYNVGLAGERPRLPRYNFAEKAEYWAMLWGFFLMGLTGLMLWNPILVTSILPGQFIPAAKAAHGAEAILAVLAILVWHIYNVHLKTFNKSMFTGKMTLHQMEDEHAEELTQIEAGVARPKPSPEATRKRERIFLPFAFVGAVVALVALYFFTSYENTAIATIPPPQLTGPVFAPLTPTPVATLAGGNQTIGAPMPHPVQGQEQCETCHGPNGIVPQPADHEGRPVESCLICHKPGPAATPGAVAAAPAITHAVQGREQCDLCHDGPDSLVPLPVDHAGRDNATCQVCHKPAGQAATSEQGMPKPIPHSITEPIYQDCSPCHGPDGVRPAPANHADFAGDSCTACHEPAAGTATPAAGTTSEAATTPESAATPESEAGTEATPPPIPHSITEAAYQDCTVCHGPGGIRPAPANHASFSVDSCTVCHKPAAGTATPAAGATSEAAATPAATATPPPIPHSITEAAYQDCKVCHGPDGIKPAPANHASFSVDSCTVCHKPATGTATPATGTTPAAAATPESEAGAEATTPPPIPHSITEAAYQDCTVCHGPGGIRPAPTNHASFSVDSCTVCHKPAQQ
jgi:cytochrome b subunit of formate dehydrogenase